MKMLLSLHLSGSVRRATTVALLAVVSIAPPLHATNSLVNTATEKSTSFANGSLAPFSICTALPRNYAVATTLKGQPCVEFAWHAAGYNGTRMARGTELCGGPAIQKEGWYGFYIYLPDPGYPMNKDAGIAQWFANNSRCNSWTGMMNMRNNDLYISHRSYCANGTNALVYANFPRNRWVSIITHFVASHLGAGKFEIFVDGVSKYNATGINFGFDTWTANDSLQFPNHVGMKLGQYDYDDSHYDQNEVRTSYYTNVTQMVGNPTGAFNYLRYPIPGTLGPITYAAESAIVGGGTKLETTNPGFHGTSYANFSATGGTLAFNNINGGVMGGPKVLTIRNALGVATRTGQLVVNGSASNITFQTTGAWTNWVTQSVTVKLNPGNHNTIELRSNGQDFANIDEIIVQ